MSITKKLSAKNQKRLCIAECLRPDLQNIRPSLVGNQASVVLKDFSGIHHRNEHCWAAEAAEEKLLDSSRRCDPVGDRRVANQVGTDPETEELELIAVRSPVIDAGMAR
jgi:hypothetical protein